MSVAEGQARKNQALAEGAASLSVGVCQSVDEASGTARISIGGSVVTMPILIRPSVGVNAHVLTAGATRLCLGPVYRSLTGEVTALPSAGKVDVLADDGQAHNLPYSTVLDLIIGDRVVIDWQSGFVLAEPASEGAVVPEPPSPPGTSVEREVAFFPTGSGSYGSTWFTDRVYDSLSNVGVYLYDGIAATIPDDAEIISVALYLNSQQIEGADPRIGLHTLTSLSGAPTVTDAVTVSPGSGWKTLPNSFGDALKTGAKTGVGTDHGGYNIYAPANSVNSGTLTIRYRFTA